ncbi:sigma-E factor negative regulatory protein [Litoribrevibacter euphylliae]|uniref:Sigma-E factor negative regulatory protein n=1 Tax=Litoribrevibacter euphylliae TaxID=1834034 RepID=A0ABV7HA89_9GAMM
MSDKIAESLSALLDDEATELDVRRLTKHMTDEDLETWRRLCAVKNGLHKEDMRFASVNLLDGIREGIADEQVVVQTSRSGVKNWLGGFGVAAAVAMAVVGIGMQNEQFSGQEGQFAQSEQPKVETSEKPKETETGVTRLAASDMSPEQYKALQDKLRSYMQHHAENSTEDRVGDVMPYARVVSFEVEEKDK